ncbi:ATP-binding cassette sub-family A member 3-like [Mizuhopecten yessoensis]|uniref:ATP-binding cassette sub-family A member 3 n=1 Tax=Mizuhopecten yessoensis TaxID=6573 RepID=A0A210QSF8_MIZYE|nr:ATP-binding cassette sub-family A member 3-like [Mizuhopecten yessoensis]OWF51666.1 ATP-binding cassette sub-family A member 3 [Mizuhopecten yessoensis]
MGMLLQFGLLLWKNFTVSRRRTCATVFEIALPLAFAFLMLVIRFLSGTTDHSTAFTWDPFTVSDVGLAVPSTTRTKIYYSPTSTAVDDVMSKVTTALNGNATVTSYASSTLLRNAYDLNSASVWAAVEFDESADYTSTLPSHVKYSLRVALYEKANEKKWYTDRSYQFFQAPGYRNNESKAGEPYYEETGFLALQYAIDKAIIDKKAPSNTLGTTYNIQLKKMAYPTFVEDGLTATLSSIMPLFLMLSFIVTVFTATKNIVQEKETKIKESMKLMGMSPTMYWLSWFTKLFIYLFVICFLFALLFGVKAGDNGSVLQASQPSLIFVFLLLFGISIIAFCFMMATIFKRATSAAFAAGILYFLFYMPQFFLGRSYDTLGKGEKVAISLLNLMAMSFGVTTITLYEGTGAGAQWSNFHQPATVDDNYSLGDAIGMLVLDSLIYFLVAWYLENVRPGEFGIPKPLYFPFTKTYWCGATAETEMLQVSLDNKDKDKFEPDPADLRAGINISHLRKVFGSGKEKKVAVADTSLNMYENQITVLLGHNGAGKTTTMSMITGFIPPTSGTAIINGSDIRKDIDGVRSSLGLCPQHNILYDNMTVEEHLWFFAKLKGCPSDQVKKEVDDIIEVMGIEAKRHRLSSTLSGGQKRKLSVGIALIGNTKVVILDEPTSGMDPAARRETWEILRKYKEGRTILLSTHFMDEADLLGDRIAIMSDGVIKCCGTSLFLKKSYGAGYHLVTVKTKDCDVSKVTSLIQSHIPKAFVESDISAELSFLLPFDESAKFVKLFEELEVKASSLGLSSFGISATTMEEVFLKVGEGASNEDDDEEEALDKSESANGIGHNDHKPVVINNAFLLDEKRKDSPNGTMDVTTQPGTSTGSPGSMKNTGIKWATQQFYGMFVKKAIHSWRNRVVSIVQLSLPVVFAILALTVDQTAPTNDDEPPLILSLTQFGTGAIPIYTDGTSPTTASTRIANLYSSYLSSFSKEDIGTTPFDTFTVEKANSIGVDTFSNTYIVGGDFDQSNTFTAYFNGEPYHAPAIALSIMTNTMLQEFATTSDYITTTNHPLSLTLAEKNESVVVTALATGFVVAFLVLFGMAFLSTSFIIFLIKERSTGAKHLQKVSGVGSFTFWLSNYLWDIINYLVPVLLILIVFAAFQTPAYVNDNRLGIVFLLFLIYGLCCLPFVYLLHYPFNVPSTGMAAITIMNILSGLATLLTVFVLQIPALGAESVADGLDWFFTILIPHYCLGQGLNNIYNNYANLQTCLDINYEVLCTFNNTLPCCSGCTSTCYEFTTDYFAWKSPGILRYIIFMLLQTCLFITIVLMIEYGVINRLAYFVSNRSNVVNPNEEELIDGSDPEDSDVMEERKRIRDTPLETLMETDALIIDNIAKTYGSLRAVKGISVGVGTQECFGLLGQNGAGKTTTFKMMTGDVFVSNGNAYLNKYDVKQHLNQVQQNLGYCPQFDALIDQMTGRETLTMYARLRGVPEEQIKTTVNDLIDTMMLRKHADKSCEVYSGGNKRKLSTAIALIGDPPFVFLDEPTTGMDPGARRKLWNVLSDVRASGRTLVMTSHSMEECDALCTKIVIMVNGKFVCLGSPQHLKNKFGQGYTLIIRISGSAGEVVPSDPIKNYVMETFPKAEVFGNHQGYLHFQIPDANIPLARVFEAMEQVKDQFDIEDYSVNQTTLEQVFLGFTRNQSTPSNSGRMIRCCGIRFC